MEIDENEIRVTLGDTWFVSRRFIASRLDVCIDRALFTLAAARLPRGVGTDTFIPRRQIVV